MGRQWESSVFAESEHIDQRFVTTCFKGWAVCVERGGEREGAGRSRAFVDTNTGIMSLRRPVKCAIHCLHLLIS